MKQQSAGKGSQPPAADKPDTRRDALKRFMQRRGLKPYPWAKRAGVSESSIYAFLKGESDSLSQRVLDSLADAAGANVAELVGEAGHAPSTVDLVGRVVRGGVVETFYIEAKAPLPQVTAPAVPDWMAGDTPEYQALRAEGDAAFPYADGSLLYFCRKAEGLDELIGKFVIARTKAEDIKGGDTFARVLMHGREPGTYTLLGMAAFPVADVKLEWAAPVRWVLQP